MRLRQRINRMEKLLPPKSKLGKNQLNPIVSWLIKNNEEFKECFKQLYRLQWKAEKDIYEWEQWKEPYRTEAEMLINRMNEIAQKHNESQVNSSG